MWAAQSSFPGKGKRSLGGGILHCWSSPWLLATGKAADPEKLLTLENLLTLEKLLVLKKL